MLFVFEELFRGFQETAKLERPAEIVGLLTGKRYPHRFVIERLHCVSNTTEDLGNYRVSPLDFMDLLDTTTFIKEDALFDFCGSIHSHPNTDAIPSDTDIYWAQIVGFKMYYLIYSCKTNHLYAYYWDGEQFVKQNLVTL